MESSRFITDAQWAAAGEGVVRKIMGFDEQMMLVQVKFESESVGTSHSHPHSQTTYVASGKFEFTIGDQTKIVATGDGLYMPPNLEHGCRCLESGVLIDCFSPMRKDFLKKKRSSMSSFSFSTKQIMVCFPSSY